MSRVVAMTGDEVEAYLDRTVHGVSLMLGNPFTVRRKDKERHFNGDPQALVHASGAEISFSINRRDNRLIVRTNYSPIQRSKVDDQFFSTKGEESVEITLSKDKTPEQVAKAIQGRVLPTFYQTITRLSADIDRHNQFVISQRGVLQRLAAAAGYTLHKNDGDRFSTSQPIDIEVTAYEKTCDVKVRLTVEEAEELVRELRSKRTAAAR